jgi:formylglycine-generating enzyme required for sulfatase activity
MFISNLRLIVLIYLIIANLTSIVVYAQVSIQVLTSDQKLVALPLDILKEVKTIYNIINDLGFCDDSSNKLKQQQDLPIPIEISLSEFKNIIGILSSAKVLLHAEEVRAKKMAIDNFAMDQADEKTRERVFEEVGSWSWTQMSPDELLLVIQAANYLHISPIVAAAVKVFAKTGYTKPSGFNQSSDDIKKLIIEKQRPGDFLALIKINQQSGYRAEEEGSFKIALGAHYRREPVPPGVKAKDHYMTLCGSGLGRFVSIPGGTYKIGSPTSEKNRQVNEKRHKVKLSPFSIMDAALTQEAYARVMGKTPSYFKDAKYCHRSFKELEINGQKISVCADHPVEMVSYEDALEFAKRMTELDPGHTYDLPTEAQLEVAFRGGTITAYVSGNKEASLDAYAWYNQNSGNQSHSIKSKQANSYDIYRSSVWEWAKDWYDVNYAGSSGSDPQGPLSGSYRVIRGGCWYDYAPSCRSAYRSYYWPDSRGGPLGFRLVRT